MTKLNYIILPDLNLILDSYSGEINLVEVLRLKGEQAKDPLWNPHFNTLADMRIANINFEEEEIETLASYQVKDNRWASERKTASLTSEANHVVFETLFNLLKPKDSKVLVRAFSTLEASLKWLGIEQEKVLFIQEILENLQESANQQ